MPAARRSKPKPVAPEDRLRRADAAFFVLTDAERAAIFRKYGRCACSMIADFAIHNPAAAAGGLLGTILGIVAHESSLLSPTARNPPRVACLLCLMDMHQTCEDPGCGCTHASHQAKRNTHNG